MGRAQTVSGLPPVPSRSVARPSKVHFRCPHSLLSLRSIFAPHLSSGSGVWKQSPVRVSVPGPKAVRAPVRCMQEGVSAFIECKGLRF